MCIYIYMCISIFLHMHIHDYIYTCTMMICPCNWTLSANPGELQCYWGIFNEAFILEVSSVC